MLLAALAFFVDPLEGAVVRSLILGSTVLTSLAVSIGEFVYFCP